MFLLDTNVISELRKGASGKANTKVLTWANEVSTSSLFISVITVLELELGVLLAERRDPPQGAILREWLDNHVIPAFKDRILNVDMTIAQRCAALHVPDPRSNRDSLIAATALVHGMTVVTRNEKDFGGTKVPLINPWH
jgi:hypothetical protein